MSLPDIFRDKVLISFIVKMFLYFLVFYWGTRFMIGLVSPGGYYSSFAAAHLDYISGIKYTLMWGVKNLLHLFGIQTVYEEGFVMRVPGKRGVIISMSCVGYAVYSFWLAYILASVHSIRSKILWIIGGLLLLWFINVCRISALLYVVSINKTMPLGIDHHTWFNIIAYLAIFILIYFYEFRSQKKSA